MNQIELKNFRLLVQWCRDFLEAVREVGASVASDSPEAQELSTWNEMYGEKGSRRKSATAISAMYL
jgi:hypothetical protein